MFQRYLRRYLRRHFHAVHVLRGASPEVGAGRPVIVFSNHPSWWDALLFLVLGDGYFPDHKTFGPIAADQLDAYPILRKVGAFPVEQNTARGGVQFLRTAEGLLHHDDVVLWVTPQGDFRDARERPLRFREGFARLLARPIAARAQVVPLALEYCFWDERKPEVLAAFGTPASTAEATPEAMADRLELMMDQLADAARSRDAEQFLPLLSSTSGVGFGYDAWRRLRAYLKGNRFNPAHRR